MGSRGQGASGCGERSPKVEVLAQVSYPCGLPGCGQEDSWHPQDPGRRAIFHVHLNHLSQLPSEAPLQPRLLPGVSRATRHGAHSHHTQHDGEADTRGFGGVGIGKGSKAGPHDRREAASTSRVQNVPEAKSSHIGHTQRLGDSEQRSSTEGLILPVALLWTGTLFFHIFLHTCFFLGRWLKLPRPLQSSML
jgi:hypothetical protein